MPFVREPMTITEARAVCIRPIADILTEMWEAPDFFLCDPVFALETVYKYIECDYLISSRAYLIEALVDVAVNFGKLKYLPNYRKTEVASHRERIRSYLAGTEDCEDCTSSLATLLALNETDFMMHTAYDKWSRDMWKRLPSLRPKEWRGLFRPGVTLCLKDQFKDIAMLEQKNKELDREAQEEMKITHFDKEGYHPMAVMELAREVVRTKRRAETC